MGPLYALETLVDALASVGMQGEIRMVRSDSYYASWEPQGFRREVEGTHSFHAAACELVRKLARRCEREAAILDKDPTCDPASAQRLRDAARVVRGEAA